MTQKYAIKDYQKGFEKDQVRIGREVARNWVWPYAYNLDDLLKVHARPDFDPDTRHYCFLGDEMVGYMFSVIRLIGDTGVSVADLDFPRMMPGHEQAAELLIEQALETLTKKGVSRITGRVTTMCPDDIRLAEKAGFTINDWGFKKYYSYEMGWGKLDVPAASVEEINPDEDLDECALLAAHWYKRSREWCRSHLREWHDAGIITHAGVRLQENLIASCMAARNDVRPSTAAIFYIHTIFESNLIPLLVRVVNTCVDCNIHNLIADLIHEHRLYEPVYQQLGFKKVAEWARCEKILR